MSTHLPTRIGKYDVVGLIGRGGIGTVYDAVDPNLDRRVAIKTIAPAFLQNADVLQSFLEETQSAASLQHRNIVDIHEVGVHEGYPYVVMEYLEGESLDSALKSCRNLSLLDKINIVIHICNGLAYAHHRGISHCNIKPANIMLCQDGGIKICDFGIAHAGTQTATRSGEVIGTLKYMAPEQVGSRTADHRADIFSTGVVLYQLISNHLPFEGDNIASTIFKIVNEPPPPLNTLPGDYPPNIEPILLRAMAKNPEHRYDSANDLAVDLEHLVEQLKEELVSREMRDVPSLVDKGDLLEAQRSLVQVLKVDHQNSGAIRLLGDVQERIQQNESTKPVLSLWVQAERALADEQFEEAREHADQALALAPDDAELQQLRETIRVEAARTERLHTVLNIAQTAQAEGNLDEARKAAEEATEVAPNNAEAKALYQLISREILERARQRQIENYLKDARQEISSRKFAGAIETLRRAEELDPNAPGVQSLLQLAVSGQQQERRREEIDGLSHEIREALSRDDYRTALRRSDEALARFPQQRTLVNLKAQAEGQFQLAERNRIVDAELAAAQGLMQEGRHQEAKERLEHVLARIGPEPRLQSVHTAVSEELFRHSMEHHRSETLHKASAALTNQAYDDAVQILEDLTKDFTEDIELHQWLEHARTERAGALQAALRGAEEEPDLNQSKIILETALQKIPSDLQLREKLTQVSHLDELVSKNLDEAGRLEEAGQYDLALAKWEMIRVLHPRHPDLKNAPKRIRGLQENARADLRQTWVDRIETALLASDYAEASALVGRAVQEFPWNSDLMELQERTESGIRQRAKAQKLLAEAQRLLSREQWETGARTLVNAYQSAPGDLLIRSQVVEGLSLASRDAMQKDRQAAEVILKELAQIEPTRGGRDDLPDETQESKQNARPQRELNANPDAQARTTKSETRIDNDQLNKGKLEMIERQLVAIIGPLAEVLVKRAAARTTSVNDMYTILAAQLDQQEDRNAFLAKKAELTSVQSEVTTSDSRATGASGTIAPSEAAKPTVASPLLPLGREMFIPSHLLIDNVRFTVTAPGSLLRGAVSEIQFWVHPEQQRETVLKRVRQVEPSEDVDITRNPEGPFALTGGARVSVRLRLGSGLTCAENHKWIIWAEDVGNASFVVTVPSEAPEGDLVGLASVRLNGCQIAKLSFLLKIGSKMLASQAIPCQTVMHRRAFASFAGDDRDEILARVQGMEAAFKGLRVFTNADALRATTYWEGELHAHINAADVFYLFWCRHAMTSDWVSREWRWALKSKGLDFIDPVPLESPEHAPPPAELAAKHFNDPLQAFIAAAGKGTHHV
jgi:serine/threonine protein kinase